MTTEIPVHVCPCGYEQNRTSQADGDATPGEGDFTVCISCGRITVFNKDMTQREPTEEDMAAIKEDPDQYAYLLKVRDTIVQHAHLRKA